MASTVPERMRVVEITAGGPPEVLQGAMRPVPAPQAGEVLVKVAVAGVNGPDIMQRKGLYPAPPGASDLPGLEIAGTVAATGEGVERWRVGDEVCALTNGGGYAEFCPVEAGHCLPIPQGLSLLEAASLPETYFTVWSNIFMGRHLAPGHVLLVHGGAGGIGSTAIQLAKAFDAKVFTTVTGDDQRTFCRDLGADRVIDYEEEDFVEVVRQETKGANVILDIIGGPYIERNIKAAAPDGRIIQLAFALGLKIEINLMPVMLKRLVYTGSTLRSRSSAFKSKVAAELEREVWPLFASGRLKPVVHTTLPLAEAAAAHRLMESGRHIGKIMLQV